MPLPFILGLGAVIAGAVGVGSGINGAKKMKDANDIVKLAERELDEYLEKLNNMQEKTSIDLGALDKIKCDINEEFVVFSDIIERIQNRPQFKKIIKDSTIVISCSEASLLTSKSSLGERLCIGAGYLLGGTILGNKILNDIGERMLKEARELNSELLKTKETIDKACEILKEIDDTANKYIISLEKVKRVYKKCFDVLKYVVNTGRTDWNEFSSSEKIATENAVLLVGLLYDMCKVEVINKENMFKFDMDNMERANVEEVNKSIRNAETILQEVA